MLFVEGRLAFDSWTAQDGSKRSKHRVTVENFQFLGQAQEKPQAEQHQDYDPDNPDDIPF
jgi:single-strand DNA-binding protein